MTELSAFTPGYPIDQRRPDQRTRAQRGYLRDVEWMAGRGGRPGTAPGVAGDGLKGLTFWLRPKGQPSLRRDLRRDLRRVLGEMEKAGETLETVGPKDKLVRTAGPRVAQLLALGLPPLPPVPQNRANWTWYGSTRKASSALPGRHGNPSSPGRPQPWLCQS